MANKGNKKLNSFANDEHDPVEYRKRVIMSSDGSSTGYEDSNFVSGDSPAVLDIQTDLERIGHRGYIANDGPGDMKYEISADGTTYGSIHTLRGGETANLENLKIKKIRLTHVDNTEYRVMIA